MTDYDTIAQLNASSIRAWMSCAKRAEYDMDNPEDIKIAVPATLVVGNLVHSGISGHKYIMPEFIEYTGGLTTTRAIMALAAGMEDKIKAFISNCEIIETEIRMEIFVVDHGSKTKIKVVGIIDLLLQNEAGNKIIVEVKTGKRTPSSALQQLAIQSWLWESLKQGEEELPTESWVLWMPANHNAEIECQKRDFLTLADEGKHLINHVKRNIVAGCLPCPSMTMCSACRIKQECNMAWK